MNDLISRQAALDAFGLSEKTRKYGGDHSGYDTRMLYEIQDVLEGLPSAEPERKKGKWVVVDADIAENSDICECSQCGGRIWRHKNVKDMWYYCPKCGADMRWKVNNE